MAATLDLFSLRDRVALVTGAGRGIGATIAAGWARAGAAVACLDLDGDAAEATATTLRDAGARAIGLRADVTDAGSVRAAVDRTVAELGGLHVTLNCAGIGHETPAEDLDPADWRRMIEVNLTGVFLCAQAEARVMLMAGDGAIVNIASMSGTIANRGVCQAHYNTAKAGVRHLTKSLAAEWAARGVRVNSLSPGYTLTVMTQAARDRGSGAEWEAQTPMGRLVRPEELVGPATFLASAASSACTGVDLLADGGFTCW
jgi:NAD(P)-dependent dehydrogenase (short-subunit alcohol dehydrogenase family)